MVNMRLIKFTEEDTIKLVELYKSHECLWNIYSANHKNKEMRQAAYEDIVLKMNKPHFGVDELKQKWKNVRCTYCQELSKIRKSLGIATNTDQIYVPALKWFSIIDSFLLLRSPKPWQRVFENLPNVNKKTGFSIDLDVEKSLENNTRLSDEDTINTSASEVTSNLNQNTMGAPLEQVPEIPTFIHKPSAHRAKNKKIKRVHLASKKPYDDFDLRHQKKINMDENEIFGQYITACLQRLPPRLAIVTRAEIHTLLMNATLKLYPDNSALEANYRIDDSMSTESEMSYDSSHVMESEYTINTPFKASSAMTANAISSEISNIPCENHMNVKQEQEQIILQN